MLGTEYHIPRSRGLCGKDRIPSAVLSGSDRAGGGSSVHWGHALGEQWDPGLVLLSLTLLSRHEVSCKAPQCTSTIICRLTTDTAMGPFDHGAECLQPSAKVNGLFICYRFQLFLKD